MDMQEVSFQEYKELFPSPKIAFDTVAFAELNKNKCQSVHYLIFRDTKIRLGIIVGERENLLCCPYSAPFSIFESNKEERLEHYERFVQELKEFALKKGKNLRIVLPPSIYGSVVSKMFSSLMRSDARVVYTDLNYHYPLYKFAHYCDFLERGTRNKFYNSQKNDFQFVKLDTSIDCDVERAYCVIKQNRKERGFPLRMTLQDVLATRKIIKADFFVMSYEGVDVAAAQVFHVAKDMAQVIYWGDLPQYSHLRTMNFFTYKVFEYYSQTNIQILDIGPSTEEGIPNYGLCEFKENIGCEVTLKHTMEL